MMSQELSALDEIKGRCTFIKVEYPDTAVRMEPTIDLINRLMGVAVKRGLTKQEVDELAEDLYSLREYLKEIQSKYPEVKKDFTPTIDVCNWLLSLD